MTPPYLSAAQFAVLFAVGLFGGFKEGRTDLTECTYYTKKEVVPMKRSPTS